MATWAKRSAKPKFSKTSKAQSKSKTGRQTAKRSSSASKRGSVKSVKPAAKVVGKTVEKSVGGKLNHLWRVQMLAEPNVRRWLIDSVGEHAIHIIREFGAPMSDEQLAQKTAIRASDVRVVLNKLHSFGLASYVRDRDKNSGWYSYVWRLNNEHARELIIKIKEGSGENTQIAAVEPAQSVEGGQERYICQTCGPATQVDFEQASLVMFRCGQCGNSLEFLEQKKN